MFKKKFQKSLWLMIAILGGLALTTTPALATTKFQTSYFSDFEADYYLEKTADGGSVLRVVEEITAVFPDDSEEHGITRQLVYTGNSDLTDGKTLALKATRNGKPEKIALIEVEPIEDAAGNDAHYFDIRIGNANHEVSGRQVYTLEYTYRNVIDEIEDLDDMQELYWNTNGTGWRKVIQHLTARVHLSEELEPKFTGDVACFVGKYGAVDTDRCEVSEIADGVQFETVKKGLSAGENLTYALGFDADTFKIDPDGYTLDTQQYTDYRLTVLLVAVSAAGAILLLLTFWAYRQVHEKRNYYKSYFVKPEYTPPHDFLVADMAENYIGSANGDKKVATLMELAVNHKIEIIKTEKDGAFGKKKTVWKIKIITDKLKKEQAIVLKILAGSNTPLQNGQEIVIKSHTATSELTKLSTSFLETIEKNLKAQDLLEKTKSKFRLSAVLPWLMVAMIVLTIFNIIWAFDEDMVPEYVILPNAGVILPLLIVILVVVTFVVFKVNFKTAKIDKHTMKGLEYSRYMDGLKMYIKMAEADRLKMLQSVKGADTTNAGIVKVYEKLLPYAVAFNLEKSWLQELGRYYELEDVATPTWFIGMGAFSAREFSSAMSSISSTASSAIISSSSSGGSGGGGFGGGGFSGGGGGGGGGGTW